MMVCSAADRIDPNLRTLAATKDRLQVLIVLSQQPQRDVVLRVEEGARMERSAARMRLEEAIGAPFSFDQDVNAARAELNRIDLEIRHEAMEEIRRIIQPQQDSVILLLRSYGATNIRPYRVTNAISAEVPSAILTALEADSNIAGVFPVAKLHPQLKFSVPAILAPTFWSAYSKGTGESVGVLDSGIDSTNSGFTGVNIVGQVFLSEGSTDPCFADTLTPADNLGHGTHVSGIVASQGGGSCPTCVGVAPGLDTLYALKVGWVVSNAQGCAGGGEADSDDVIDAMDWAIANTTVKVFNFSYAGPASGDDDPFSQVLDQIGDAYGINIAFAAGNAGNGSATVESPGISYNGVTVASMDDQGNPSNRSGDVISSWSLPGPTAGGRYKPDISAPGNHNSTVGGILSTCLTVYWSPGDYCQMEGTSMASPHAAGSLALIRSAGAPDGMAAKAVLLNSALAYKSQSAWRTDSGWGFVDLAEASLQVANDLTGSVTAAGPAFYAGAVSGTLKTTLVWSRHLTGSGTLSSSLSNLDLYAYDGASGNEIGSSTSTIQNVEQVITTDTGTVVLAVEPVSIAGVTSEPYALAVSAAGFSAKKGPALAVSCTGPSGGVAVNATFTVPCTVTNTGDLTAFTVSGTLNWQGSSGGPTNQFGNAGAGQQSGAQSWQITAPSSSGEYTLEANVSSASYGQTFTAETTVAVVVWQTYTLTTAVSPPSAGGIIASPLPTSGVYAAGTQVCLTATPATGWLFSYWSGATVDSSNCLTLNSNVSVTANFVSASALHFVPMTPCRVVDTRYANGAFGSPELAAGSTRDFVIPGGSCNIPATAAAYSLNVTVVPNGALGWLTVWPSGQTQPHVSTLNSADGRIKANAAIVPAGAGGAVSVYVTDATNVILDIDGYFVPAASNATALAFYPLPPCRVADTRYASFGALLGPPSLSAGQPRGFPILSSSCNVPASAAAYSLNFTAVPPAPFLYITTYPTGQTRPLASTLNDPTGTIVANAAIVPAGTGGSVNVYSSGATDVVIDINGYFAPPGAGGLSLYNLTPCRALDTRLPAGSPPFSGEQDVNVSGSGCGAPAAAQAYVFNATVVPPGPMLYLTLWPQGGAKPLVSTLNAIDGVVTSNMAIVPTSNGSISAYVSVPNTSYLVLDIFGYFAP
jgi:hypothetical protein